MAVGAERLPILLVKTPALIIGGVNRAKMGALVYQGHYRKTLLEVESTTMNTAVTIPADRLQILGAVCAAMRPERSVVDLQQISTAAPATSPSGLIQNPATVQTVNSIHQPNEGDTLGSMLRLG